MHCVDDSKELVNLANADENFLKNIITGDENWVYSCVVKIKAHSLRSTASLVQCERGTVLFLLWGRNSPWISTSWLDGEQGIVSEGDEKAEKCSEEIKAWFVEGKKWMLHLETLRCFPVFWFTIFFTKHETTLNPQPPYLPEFAPADFFLFTNLNPHWKDNDFSLLRRLKKIRWQSYALLQNRHSRDVSKTGINAGSHV
jgi:hypothetical protein